MGSYRTAKLQTGDFTKSKQTVSGRGTHCSSVNKETFPYGRRSRHCGASCGPLLSKCIYCYVIIYLQYCKIFLFLQVDEEFAALCPDAQPLRVAWTKVRAEVISVALAKAAADLELQSELCGWDDLDEGIQTMLFICLIL